MLKMTFGALVAAGLLLASTGALARPSNPAFDRYDRVGRPGTEQVREARTERNRHEHARQESRTQTRAPHAIDTRRNRGELWGDASAPRSFRSESAKSRSSSGRNPMSSRASQVSNCSEYANCGGSSDGSTAKRSGSSSSSAASRQDAYKRRVWLNWAKQFEKKYLPAKATTVEDFLP